MKTLNSKKMKARILSYEEVQNLYYNEQMRLERVGYLEVYVPKEGYVAPEVNGYYASPIGSQHIHHVPNRSQLRKYAEQIARRANRKR